MVCPAICKRANCPLLRATKTIISGVTIGRASYFCGVDGMSTRMHERCPREILGERGAPILVEYADYIDKEQYPATEYNKSLETLRGGTRRYYVVEKTSTVPEYRTCYEVV